MIISIARYVGLIYLVLNLCSCAVLEYDKGLEAGEIINERTTFFASSFWRTERPSLFVKLDSTPKSSLLAFSPPIVPLPVIPWPPGIIDLIQHKQEYEPPAEYLAIQLSFLVDYVRRMPHTTQFIFSPQEALLRTNAGREYTPSKVSCTCGRGNGLAPRCAKTPDGKYLFSVYSNASPECMLTYPISTAEVFQAMLDIQNLVFQGDAIDIRLLIRRGHTIRMEYVGP